jgi:hypothetical protein
MIACKRNFIYEVNMETTVRWTGNGGMSFLQKPAQAMQF